jgi:hypothetical protein
MIVLLPPAVADALIRCTADLRRVAVTESIKAPPGYIRFDNAVAAVMQAASGPELKVRAALRQAIADGDLNAHDHEFPRLKLSSPDGPEDHHVVSEVALRAWLDRSNPNVSITGAAPALSEGSQRAAASDPSSDFSQRSRVTGTGAPAEPSCRDDGQTEGSTREAAPRKQHREGRRVDAIAAAITENKWPLEHVPYGMVKELWRQLENGQPALFLPGREFKNSVFYGAWKAGRAQGRFGTMDRA